MTAATITFQNWLNVGAETLIKTQLSKDGDTLRADLRLFSVASGREELKVSESVAAKDARRLAHKLANAVYKHFTKETGPFESRIAYVRKTGGGKDVYLADWDGKNAAPVSNGNINVLPAVAPDRSVAFTSYKRGKPDLLPRAASGRLAHAARRERPHGRRGGVLARRQAHRVLGVRRRERRDLRRQRRRQRRDQGDRHEVLPQLVARASRPDGKKLAFVSNRGGSPQVYVMNADGSDVKRLTFQGNYNQTPAWSPRGDLIAFTARDERNAFDLFTIEVASGKVKRLTQDTKNNEEPSFSPNGRLILFTSTRGGSKSLYVMTFDGNNQIALPLDKGDYTTPDWGP